MSHARHTDTPRNLATSRTGGQTRRRARDADDEKEQHPQPSAHVSPAMRIYRHALESVFALLDLGDLSRILAVSREWAAAVRSMKPINARIERDKNERGIREKKDFRPLPPIASIVGSPLLRHLASIQISGPVATWTPLDNASLGLLAQHAPNLQSLWCALQITSNEPLVLPARLTSLVLQLPDDYTDPTINGVLTTVAALPSLSVFELKLSQFAHFAADEDEDADEDADEPESSIELSILTGLPSLTDLSLGSFEGGPLTLSDTQVDQIRSSLGHLSHFSAGRMKSKELERFLQPPVAARWRNIGFVYADERTGELLLRLPTLTKLDLTYRAATAHVDFLSQLPLLAALTLDCREYCPGPLAFRRLLPVWLIPPDALLASLLRCIGLTELDLRSGFNSAHWSALFAKLTKIKKLTISLKHLWTLECFAAGPITQSLEELTLEQINLPLSELAHLYALRRLRTLDLQCCFDRCLDDASFASLSPPTPLLPSLTSLFHRWQMGSGGSDYRERRGASFEWMQARRTQ